MCTVAMYRRENTSGRYPQHVVFPDLLRGARIQPNQVFATDISQIPIDGGVYLLAVMGKAALKYSSDALAARYRRASVSGQRRERSAALALRRSSVRIMVRNMPVASS